jgi:hypothetical protein
MKINPFTAAIALLSALALCATPPIARAEVPAMDGVYTYADEDGVVATWSIRTTCTPGCVAHVTTAPGRGFDAPLVNGCYTVTRIVPEGAVCPGHADLVGETFAWSDGGEHPVKVHQWWDPRTLTGEVDFLESSAPCGLHDLRDTFTPTRIG